MITARFTEIQSSIVNLITQTESRIIVVVAWFTNELLYNHLCNKQSEGVQVKVVLLDDLINRGTYGLNFSRLVDLGGEVYFVNEQHPIHHKFAIFDNHSIITGSYNWTYFAEYKNRENILICSRVPTVVGKYLLEFENINKQLYKPQLKNKVVGKSSYFTRQNEIARRLVGIDLLYKGKLTNDRHTEQIGRRLMGKSNESSVSCQKNNNTKKATKTAIDIGVEYYDSEQNKNFGLHIPQDSTLPIQQIKSYNTLYDNQKSVAVRIYTGDVKDNICIDLIGEIQLSNLPMGNVGEVILEEKLAIDKYGKLNVRVAVKNTEVVSEAIFDIEKFLY